MVEWGDADDDGYPDTEEGHNEYEKDCQSGKTTMERTQDFS